MYDFIVCKTKLPVPENFLNLDWENELFRTNSLSNKFENYVILEDGYLYRQKSNLEKINYNGFINFSTHFFDEPQTKQYYIAFFSSFKNGLLEELSLDGIKDYNIEDYIKKYTIQDYIKKYKPIEKTKSFEFVEFIKGFFKK